MIVSIQTIFQATIAFAGLSALAAPTSGDAQFVIKNQCKQTVQVGQLENGQSAGQTTAVNAGSSHTFNVASDWQGRFWGRYNCSGTNCTTAGAADPASLAEFTLKGAGGNDYYDVSFVDGFNLPIGVDPINPSSAANSSDKYQCGSPTCATLPSCPSELQVKDASGNTIGCFSACSKFGTDAYCCAGADSTPQTCPANQYSLQNKKVCPDVYTYAYDDKTSTYMCQASGYTITFCPSS